jgi:hypothetical protein
MARPRRSTSLGGGQADASVNEQADESSHRDSTAPRHPFTEGEAIRGAHDLVNRHVPTMSSQSGALCADIPAHTGTGLSILHEAERDEGGEDDQPGKASHAFNYRFR